jgi:hypothetical protein
MDFFDDRFEDDSDLDQAFDPHDVMSSYDGYFPPGDGKPSDFTIRQSDGSLASRQFHDLEKPILQTILSFAAIYRRASGGIGFS